MALALAPCTAQTAEEATRQAAQAAAQAAIQAVNQSVTTPPPAEATATPGAPVPIQDINPPATPSSAFTGKEESAAPASAPASDADADFDDPALPLRPGETATKPEPKQAEKVSEGNKEPEPTAKKAVAKKSESDDDDDKAPARKKAKPTTSRSETKKVASKDEADKKSKDSASSLKAKVQEQRVLGNADAPILMIEFADLQCPDSRRYAEIIFPEVRRDYIETGAVRYEVRALPLDMHPQALAAEQAARLAGEQGRYWDMRQLLLANQQNLNQGTILGHAQSLGLDMTKFESGARSGRWLDEIMAEKAGAQQAGINKTPTILITRPAGDGPATSLAAVSVPRDFRSFKREADRALGGQAPGPPAAPRRGIFGGMFGRNRTDAAPAVPSTQAPIQPADGLQPSQPAGAATGATAPMPSQSQPAPVNAGFGPASDEAALNSAMQPSVAAPMESAPSSAEGVRPGEFRSLVATPAPNQPAQPHGGMMDSILGRNK